MPQVGVEFDTLLLAASGDFDASEPPVPFGLGFGDNPLKIPAVQFRFQILSSLLLTDIRDSQFHHHDLILLGGKFNIKPGIFTFDLGQFDDIFFPCHDLRKRLTQLNREIHGAWFSAPAGTFHRHIALEFGFADGTNR